MEENRTEYVMKDIFACMEEGGHEQVTFFCHGKSGLRAIVAIHDSTLGPALGGCRMIPYSTTQEALDDVLQLSQGMTRKCALADVDFGGGKMVILPDTSPTEKSPELFRAVGRFVSSLQGRFYTGTDMGTSPEDFIHAAKESKYIVGLPEYYGGSGDTSISTAMGVLQGMRATAQYLYGSESLEGKVVAIQGIGKVGARLAGLLLAEGAELIIADVHLPSCLIIQRMSPESVEITTTHKILETPCDFLVPCARGGIVNTSNIHRFQCRAIIGSANNQLESDECADLLAQREILYAPDYLVNAGGLIQVAMEILQKTKECAEEKARFIYEMLLLVYKRAEQHQISTCQAANEIVEERLEKIADIRRIYLG
ncbi:glutamate dehydrogenase/leucine dehydrogenase [Croceifilum oryzae]|uniref:Glutamate dehydrogenase/leucine dehydrogenase n=1 Tax=Croceifilum oryzae TaxID=1553429 RepID=A0AAJ1TPS8_9BACL|nr:Glu/Leu/Phe/Val dehydrogenase dimerization domain-containing protein [Croceifilum oryzae]MDQ0418710.1 glutamate dehydrogenase/leucine dehydrogenase [Croceifilum oryzae]